MHCSWATENVVQPGKRIELYSISRPQMALDMANGMIEKDTLFLWSMPQEKARSGQELTRGKLIGIYAEDTC